VGGKGLRVFFPGPKVGVCLEKKKPVPHHHPPFCLGFHIQKGVVEQVKKNNFFGWGRGEGVVFFLKKHDMGGKKQKMGGNERGGFWGSHWVVGGEVIFF